MMKGRESEMPDESYWATFFNPACIVEKLGCDRLVGDVVEFGCGHGTFTIATAERVSGSVYAMDIDPEMIEATRLKALERGLSNVVLDQRDFVAHGCGRPDGSVQHVQLYNILHIDDPIPLLRETFRVLQPGGVVSLIHWRSDIPTPRGPSMLIRPTATQCRAWGESVGLEFVREQELCCCSWHWGLLMRRA